MYHLGRSRNLTLLSMFHRRRIHLRSWLWYLREKKLKKQQKKLNSCHRTMATMTTTATTMIMRKKK
jgi:hypothetical protein